MNRRGLLPEKRLFTFATKEGISFWVMDADGGNHAQLTHVGLNVYPTWSPDGKRIAFVSRRGGVAETYVMDENGDNQERRTGNKADKSKPSWSPGANIVTIWGKIKEPTSVIRRCVRRDLDIPFIYN